MHLSFELNHSPSVRQKYVPEIYQIDLFLFLTYD
jgi:hypothetical protein